MLSVVLNYPLLDLNEDLSNIIIKGTPFSVALLIQYEKNGLSKQKIKGILGITEEQLDEVNRFLTNEVGREGVFLNECA